MESTKKEGSAATAQGKIIEVDEGIVRSHLDRVLKGTVEETLNALLDEEAEHPRSGSRTPRSGRRPAREAP